MWAAVRWNAALMNGNPYAHWEQCGISLHLMPWSAALCHGMPYLAPGFPGGIWTDGVAFRKIEHRVKFRHL